MSEAGAAVKVSPQYYIMAEGGRNWRPAGRERRRALVTRMTSLWEKHDQYRFRTTERSGAVGSGTTEQLLLVVKPVKK